MHCSGPSSGASVGRTLDQYGQLHTQAALEHNPSGRQSVWVNPDTGARVSVMPTRTYQTGAGQYCREYQTPTRVGGNVEQAYGPPAVNLMDRGKP